MSVLRFASLLVSASLLASCANATNVDDDGFDWSDEGITSADPGAASAHILPVRQPSFLREAPVPTAGAVKLEWFGGPVLSNVKIVTVHWGSGVQFGDYIDAFYKAVAQSAYFDWLHEYNTAKQTIGRGSFVTRYVDTGAPTSKSINDTDIRAELQKLIAANKVPQPDANTLYMFHFPPGVTITLDQYQSCSYFCAYHNTVDLGNDKFLYYGVIPDMGGACTFGCGFNLQQNTTTSVASHELIEAVTDPAVGAVPGEDYVYPLAWYDQQGGQGEIGDICNGQQDTVATFTVQKEWSNEKNGCITTKPGDTPPPVTDDFTLGASPSSRTIVAGGSTTFTVTTAVASGQPGAIALVVSGLPAGATGTFDHPSVSPGATATLTIATTASAAAGTTAFTVSGKAGTMAHGADLTLVIQGQTPPPTGNLVVNGGLEAGNKSGWQVRGTKVWATQRRAHTGTWSGKLGSALGSNGDNALYQGIAVPATGKTTLSFWYYPICHGTIETDHQQAFITDASGNRLQTLLDVCEIKKGWTKVTADLSAYAGKTVMVYFNDHDAGTSDTASYLYLDDVATVTQ